MSKKMYLAASAVAWILVFSPVPAFAAFNDVSLTTDTVISVNSISLDVSASTAVMQSITINATTFSVELLAGSSIRVSSAARKDITVDKTNLVTNSTCTATESTITVASSEGGVTNTVVFTPTASGCSNTSGGGGGGGGGSSSSTADEPEEEESVDESVQDEENTVEAAEPARPSIPAVFTRTLGGGVSGEDVKRLQQLLNSDQGTKIAEFGVGSPGNETDYFGTLTEAAVQRFQAKYGIVSSGDPSTTGYGLVGPKTRAKLAEVFGGVASAVVPSAEVSAGVPSALPNRALFLGVAGEDVMRLQQLLNGDPDTQVAPAGVGSSGNETNYFGSLTENAVQKFQIKYSIVANSSDPGYGYVGPKTRAKLQELFGS